MHFKAFRKFAALALAGAAFASAPAEAAIVSGAITGGSVFGSGSVVTLGAADTPFSVGFDNFNTNNLYVFNEVQDFALLSDLTVALNGTQVTLAMGTLVRSHLIAFDPLLEQTVRATLTFDSTILGVARTDAQLAASNYLGLPGVTYTMPAGVGLEPGLDILSFSSDSLGMRLGGASPGDVLRVLTVGTLAPSAAVPEPSTWVMMLLGFGAVGTMLRRRRPMPAIA